MFVHFYANSENTNPRIIPALVAANKTIPIDVLYSKLLLSSVATIEGIVHYKYATMCT